MLFVTVVGAPLHTPSGHCGALPPAARFVPRVSESGSPVVQLAAPGPAVNGGPAGATGNEIRVAGSGLSMAGPTALLIQLESECPSQVSPVYASCAGDCSEWRLPESGSCFFGKHIYRLNAPLTAVDPVDPQIPSRLNPPGSISLWFYAVHRAYS